MWGGKFTIKGLSKSVRDFFFFFWNGLKSKVTQTNWDTIEYVLLHVMLPTCSVAEDPSVKKLPQELKFRVRLSFDFLFFLCITGNVFWFCYIYELFLNSYSSATHFPSAKSWFFSCSVWFSVWTNIELLNLFELEKSNCMREIDWADLI